MKTPRVCVIGAGNVATHIAQALAQAACVCQIVSRHKASAQKLADLVGAGCIASDNLKELRDDADFYIISVNDDSIAKVVADTPDFNGVWAHTSGSVPAEVFAGKKSRYGVFYPLQTFTRDLDVDMSEIPFFIEGSDRSACDALLELARSISNVVEIADSRRRKQLHLAAVFACNFANLMWMEADEILRSEGLTVNYLMPLLEMTLGKLRNLSPAEAMTGPARRHDAAIIESHLRLLPAEKREIYSLLSETIMKRFPARPDAGENM